MNSALVAAVISAATLTIFVVAAAEFVAFARGTDALPRIARHLVAGIRIRLGPARIVGVVVSAATAIGAELLILLVLTQRLDELGFLGGSILLTQLIVAAGWLAYLVSSRFRDR